MLTIQVQLTTRHVPFVWKVDDLKEALQEMFKTAGVKGIPLLFLMTDGQIVNERFLIYINDILANGWISDLFPKVSSRRIFAFAGWKRAPSSHCFLRCDRLRLLFCPANLQCYHYDVPGIVFFCQDLTTLFLEWTSAIVQAKCYTLFRVDACSVFLGLQGCGTS